MQSEGKGLVDRGLNKAYREEAVEGYLAGKVAVATGNCFCVEIEKDLVSWLVCVSAFYLAFVCGTPAFHEMAL